MKKLLTIILALLPILAFSQIKYDSVRVVKPQNFVEALSIDTAIVQIISQKAGVNRRVNFQTVADWILAQQPNLDSAQYANDTLLLFYGPDTILAVIPSGTIDTAYLSGDTLGIIFAGDTTEVVLVGLGDGNGIFDATNDGDTTAIGSVVLGEDLTVELNNHDWLFDGLVEDDTTSRIMTLRGDGSLAYRWLDSLLNGYTTGSGTPGTLPIWTGGNALGNSSLTEASGVLSSSLTGALKLPAGTDAQDPVWAAGMLRYNTTTGGFQGYNTAERYLPWADADNWTNAYIPYSNGSQLTAEANFRWTGGLSIGSPPTLAASNRTLSIKSQDIMASFWNSANLEKVRIFWDGSYRFQNLTAGQNIQWGTGSSISYSTTQTDRWIVFDSQSGGSAGAWTFKSGSTQLAQIGLLRIGRYDTHNNTSLFGFSAPAIYGHSDLTSMIISGYQPPTSGAYNGGSIVLSGGRSSGTDTNSGNIFIRNGTQNASGSNSTGTLGKVFIQIYKDSSAVAVAPTLYNLFVFDGDLNWQFLQRKQTTTGIQTLTMEGDTVKYRIENIGAISTSTDASGDIVVAHGMGVTPTSVQVTVTGTTPYVVTVHTIGSTNFTVRFYDMTGAAVASTAVTATWHAKT